MVVSEPAEDASPAEQCTNMRIIFASAHPYKPQIAGGTQSNTHEMALALQARGHEVAVLCGLTGAGYIGLRNRVYMKATGNKAIMDRTLGYPVFRSWFAWEGVAQSVDRFRPDVAVIQSGKSLRLASVFRKHRVPLLIYNHNIDFDQHEGAMEDFKAATFVANSRFTAKRYREAYGVRSEIIVPLFDRSLYTVDSQRTKVLFVNPHPQKGLEIALYLARTCSDVPFSFVRGWPLAADVDAHLSREVSRLQNVRLYKKTDRMADHYREARIVVVPSIWAETWVSVVTESQFSGIPVVASDVGGLPEAVGPGGILVDPKGPLEAWKEALRSLWDDPELYRRYSTAASSFSNRDEINIDRQLDCLEGLLNSAVATSARENLRN